MHNNDDKKQQLLLTFCGDHDGDKPSQSLDVAPQKPQTLDH